MSRQQLGLASLVSLLLLAPAMAQQNPSPVVGELMPELVFRERNSNEEIRFGPSAYRGRIIVMYFWRASNQDSLEWLDKLKGLFTTFGPKGVRFINCPMDEKEKADKILADRGISDVFPPDDTTEEAKVLWTFRGQGWMEIFGAGSHPYVLVIDPDGYFAWRGNPNDRLEERLTKLVEQTNPPIVDSRWLGRRLRTAEKLHDEGEFGRAYAYARDVAAIADKTSSDFQKADALMGKLEVAATNWLSQIPELERADNFEKAAYIAAQVSINYETKDTKKTTAKAADAEIGRMRGSAKQKELVRKAIENARGELLIMRATDLEERKLFDRASVLYREVVKKYEETEAAKTAATALERMLSNPSVVKAVEESRRTQEAIRLFDIAERLEKNELYEQARETYQRLIKDYAGTRESKLAADRIKSVPAPDKETAQAGKPEPANP